ncbi:MAG: DUF4129 domain-containing protein [Geitlerinemataceae cyanobacterium]
MMSVSNFESTNWGWRWQQWQQQAQEWVELQLSQFFPSSAPTTSEDANTFTPWDLDWLVRGVGIVLLVWIAWLLGRWIWQLWNRGMLRTPATRSTSKEKPGYTVRHWLARSQQQQAKGNYRAACRCLYLAMLQRLQDTEVIPNLSNLTDGEYRQLLQQQPRHSSYEVLLETHERLYFGKRKATSDTFDSCQKAYRDIEEDIKEKS